jgi:DGQHR domain-containing protein
MSNEIAKEAVEIKVDTERSKFGAPLLEEEATIRKSLRLRRRSYDEKTVHIADITDEESNGWALARKNNKSARVRRDKPHDRLLEDRVWTLCARLGYPVMNGDYFKIEFERDSGSRGRKQVDVYAEDTETVMVIECKSKETRGRRSLQKDILETSALQKYIRESINRRFESRLKPKVIWIYATNNIIWSEEDARRAEDASIQILTENELQYLETFVNHMGPAGRYQILGDFLKGQKIPGMSGKKLPAISGSFGKEEFYCFSATPRDLLKIAFVNHQALNPVDARPAYQRMVNKGRIKQIGDFITGGGFFPTNILINFSKKPKFEPISNKDNSHPSVKFGMIELPSVYRSAWVIDGQHRLFGYSGLADRRLDDPLIVLAFKEMKPEKEANLFIAINSKQKSVPRSLLVSLLADLRLGDDDPKTALSALGSAVIRQLDRDKTSPFFRRFKIEGVSPELQQNLTVSEVVKGLTQSQLIGRALKKSRIQGPLAAGADEASITRATKILAGYFGAIERANPRRWREGGKAYISTNPGIRAHLQLIGELMDFMRAQEGADFITMKPDDVVERLVDFIEPFLSFVKTASDKKVEELFSRKFGEGGVKEYRYNLINIIHSDNASFAPEEFTRWKEQGESKEIEDMNSFILSLAERFTDFTIQTLRDVHGTHMMPSGEPAYFELGVESPKVRENCFKNQQSDDPNRRREKIAYLDLLNIRDVVKQKNNWDHFEYAFNNPRPGEQKGKKYYLDWMHHFNALRKIAAHKNQARTYKDEDIEFVDWLRADVEPKVPDV